MTAVVSRRTQWLIAVGCLAALLALGGWLRWRYALTSSLHVDEFTTLWAALRVKEFGAPLMPSGVLYTRGLLASYVEALSFMLLGSGILAGRAPSLLFGLTTIVALFAVGRRSWGAAVGWLAAVGLTLLPEAVVWSGRARFYSQFQLLTLLTLWAAYESIAVAPVKAPGHTNLSPRLAHFLFVCFFVLALFTQEQAALLYPPIFLAGLLWRGWRWLTTPSALVAHLTCLIALIVRFLMELFGQPGYFETIQAQRPYVGIVLDGVGAWRVYGPLLVAPERLPWTVFAVLAVIAAAVHLTQSRRLASLRLFHQATLFFALQLGFALTTIFFLVGTSWRETRYLFFVQPVWLLLGAAGAVWAVEHLTRRPRIRLAAYVGLTLALAALLWRPAHSVLAQEVEGYDRVLAALAAQRQPDDVILTPQPPACAFMLGRCDYYALQRGFEEFVIEREGRQVDRWTGATLLNTRQGLEEVVRNNQRVWFVGDAFRLATRYEADFLRTLIEQFQVTIEERGVMALLAEGWRAPAAPIATAQLTPPVRFGPLALTGWERGAAQPGATLPVTLFWRGMEPIGEQINTSVRVVATDGRIIAQQDGPPARGIIPTTLFFDTPLPDPKLLTLPPELSAGRYRLETVAYRLADGTPLSDLTPLDWFTIGSPPETAQNSVQAVWQNGLLLLDNNGAPADLTPGESIAVRLVWSSQAQIDRALSVFLHLLGPDGAVVSQRDQAPQGGFYPTWAWKVGDVVEDVYTLTLPPELPPGDYRLAVGWYDPATGERVSLLEGGDLLQLAQWSANE